MLSENEKLILRYGYKIEYSDNNKFFVRFNRKMEIAKVMPDKRKRHTALWDTADNLRFPVFYWALLKAHFPEFYNDYH